MKRLLIDIPALMDSGHSVEDIQCEYFYHRKNNGQFNLLEIAESIYNRVNKKYMVWQVEIPDEMEMQKLNPDRLVADLKAKLDELLVDCIYDTPYFDGELHKERTRTVLEALILCQRLEEAIKPKGE